MSLQVRRGPVDIPAMTKWQSEAEMNAELRRIASEMRELKEELRSYISGESPYHRRGPALPIDDDRKLRGVGPDDDQQPRG
jgi:hypothetical protein